MIFSSKQSGFIQIPVLVIMIIAGATLLAGVVYHTYFSRTADPTTQSVQTVEKTDTATTSAQSETTASAIATSTQSKLVSSSISAIQQKNIKTSNATNAIPVIKNLANPASTKDEKIKNCAIKALPIIEQNAKQYGTTTYTLELIDGRELLHMHSYVQITHYNSSRNECIISEARMSDNIGTTTLFDVFQKKVIAYSASDFNAPDFDSGSPCKILGISGCSNQQFEDFARQKIGGDNIDPPLLLWEPFTSSRYSYQVLFPNTPHLGFSSSTERTSADKGQVLEIEAWESRLDQLRASRVGEESHSHYSIYTRKYNFFISPLLDLSGALERLVNDLLELVKISYPDAKLVSTEPTQYEGSQALDFKIISGTTTIKGRVLFIRDVSYILSAECSLVDCNDIVYYQFLNSFHVLKDGRVENRIPDGRAVPFTGNADSA